MEQVDTAIIGAGQAGLAMSYYLSRHGHPHLVLERHRIAERWRSERWDGLHFQSPNMLVELPGFHLPHTDPDAFATGAEIADFIADYAMHIAAPVRTGVAVSRLRENSEAPGFVLETAGSPIAARNVVVATGPFQRPIIPDFLAPETGVLQLHASAYRNPGQLPDGAVLVIGAGASGAQIAHELLRAGRQVYFSIGKHRRAPRRYRGHDHIWWWKETGMAETLVEKRGPDRSPLVHSGAYGGHTIDFRQFAADGMILVGRTATVDGGVVHFADDLHENLAFGDRGFLGFMDFVDEHIRRKGLDLPEDLEARRLVAPPPSLSEPLRRLDLLAAGVGTVIWATGYGLDFGWIEVPVLDSQGTPIQKGGVSTIPGLYFLGLHFMSRMSSAFIFGVGADAELLAHEIASRA